MQVTWVEHAEYDESQVHQLYRPLLSSGMGFGAQRWIATLQRQCECLAILMSSSVPSRDHTGKTKQTFSTLLSYSFMLKSFVTQLILILIFLTTLAAITAGGRRSMLKLAQRMTDNFCAGVCASTVHKWNKLNAGNVDEDVRVMTRKSVDDPGEPPGIVLSAATSVWLPVSPQRLFDFLRDERLRSEWDILSNGGPMQEMAHIAKGQDHGNCVSLLRASVSVCVCVLCLPSHLPSIILFITITLFSCTMKVKMIFLYHYWSVFAPRFLVGWLEKNRVG